MRVFSKFITIAMSLSLGLAMFTSCVKNLPLNSSDDSTANDNTSISDTTNEEGNDEIRDITSWELVKDLKIGWNLGNTLEATGGQGLDSETSWGNPKATKEMIDKVRESGFNVVRLPVTWYNHFIDQVDNLIDPAWMARVKEVVDYAYDEGMYVIINIHHENWHFPSEDNKESAKTILKDVWTQISEAFKGYSERLIFEGLNEPRLVKTEFEWNGGTPEARQIINEFNEVFIETVRNSGGNNKLRHLMIPTYCASSNEAVLNDMVIPDDDKVIISIHAYLPYNFALKADGTDRFDPTKNASTTDIKNVFKLLKERFTDKNIAAIMGECGAMVRNQNIEALESFAKYYIGVATWAGIPCIVFDNGAFISGETFGLLDRKLEQCDWRYPTIIESYMEGLENPIAVE